MRRHPRPPGMFRPDIDPDARAPFKGSDVETAVFEVETRPEEVGAILGERDPHRLGQIAGSATQLVIARGHAAPPPHRLEPINRGERANQHRRGRSLRLGHDVHHPVDAVVEIHVGVAGFAIHRRVPARGTGRRVTRRIVFADVRLDLDDDAAGSDAAPLVNENRPQQIASDVQGGAIVKGSRELHSADRLAVRRAQPRDGALGGPDYLRIAVGEETFDER